VLASRLSVGAAAIHFGFYRRFRYGPCNLRK
jgi:hypothetical protein